MQVIFLIYDMFLIYRGCSESRNGKPSLPNQTQMEEYLFNKECQLGLNKINFEQFRAAIKRFGYQSDLNDQHMHSISKQINININELDNFEKSIACTYYKDPEFVLVKGRY